MSEILKVEQLKKYYPVRKNFLFRTVQTIKAVDGIDFSVSSGEIVGMVGESGSGKSTAGRTCIRLLEPTSGKIHFLGEDLRQASASKLRALRQKVQMVFQDPLASLNPRKTILDNVGEALLFHRLVTNKEQQKKEVAHILEQVGLSASVLNQYPHQFSGGQQQRISIARALVLRPKLLIFDEITSALDLSVQAQVLNLLMDLKKKFKLSYLMITHDLNVVRHLCDKVLVMHQGKIVESGECESLFAHPQNDYTKRLLKNAYLN